VERVLTLSNHITRLGVEHIPNNLTLESVNQALVFDLALYLQMHSFLQKKKELVCGCIKYLNKLKQAKGLSFWPRTFKCGCCRATFEPFMPSLNFDGLARKWVSSCSGASSLLFAAIVQLLKGVFPSRTRAPAGDVDVTPECFHGNYSRGYAHS